MTAKQMGKKALIQILHKKRYKRIKCNDRRKLTSLKLSESRQSNHEDNYGKKIVMPNQGKKNTHRCLQLPGSFI